LLSVLIPPFQSPDEFDHIKRAYLLRNGQFILDTPKGSLSGGMIDTGLVEYMSYYDPLPFRPEKKLSLAAINQAKQIKWTGKKQFSCAPGTGYYFPIIYLPQTVGLTVGQLLGLSIDQSYQLARLSALIVIAFLLLLAFNTYPTNPLAIALLLMPMTLFQCASASLDGVSTALAIFAISAFLRIATDRQRTPLWLFYALAGSVFLIAMSRAHLLGLVTLILGACGYLKQRRYFFIFGISLLMIVGWLAVAMKTTFNCRVVTGSTLDTALFYLKHPYLFFKLILVSLNGHRSGYASSFFGILGWLDTPFALSKYYFWGILTLLIGLLTFSSDRLQSEWLPRSLLLFNALASTLLVFFTLLITWTTHHPATIIDGVQGRYFLVPTLLLAYAISDHCQPNPSRSSKIAMLLVILLGIFNMVSTTKVLINRYYLVDNKTYKVEKIVMSKSIVKREIHKSSW
jgi:uncharacterized membrane protein